MVLISIFLVTNNVQHPYMCLFVIHISPLMGCLSIFLSLKKLGCLFVLLSLDSSLYFLDINPVSDKCFPNVFLPVFSSSFYSLNCFKEQMYLILMKSILSICFLMMVFLVLISYFPPGNYSCLKLGKTGAIKHFLVDFISQRNSLTLRKVAKYTLFISLPLDLA